MAKEGKIFKTTSGEEVYRNQSECLQAVKNWLAQNGEPYASEERCKEKLDEFAKRFKVVDDKEVQTTGGWCFNNEVFI